ncbi:hypothetical protein IQ238_22595 [Pleurocapsales cyanobacterium LEGE 06147]|nr:hypothetical protein [Pleurocapsales cyanobacterium LEGE 06147]
MLLLQNRRLSRQYLKILSICISKTEAAIDDLLLSCRNAKIVIKQLLLVALLTRFSGRLIEIY